MAVIGISLFVAGYHQTRRQAEYTSLQITTENASYLTIPASASATVTPLFASRLIRPS
jgi:hypothetical protein